MEQEVSVISAAISDSELSLATDLGLELTASKSHRFDEVVARFNHAAKSIVEAGVLLLSIKIECERGEFENLLSARDIPSQRASEAMRYAKFTAMLPPSDRAKVMELPKKKVLALASAEPDVISQALGDDELFHDLTSMDYQAMRRKLRQMESRNADLEVELDTARAEKADLRNQLSHRTDTPWAEFVMTTRHEGGALTDKATLCIDDLDRLARDLTEMPAALSQSKDLRVAVNSLYTQVNGLLSRASGVVKMMHQEFGELLEANMPETLYSEEERLQALADRSLMIQDHKQEAQIRSNERETSKPRGRGRPKKQ